MASFCTNCGSPVAEGASFCTSCGNRVEAAGGSPPSPPLVASEVSPTPTAPAPPGGTPTAPPAKPSSGFLKIVALVLGFFALVTVVGIGSCFYVGYRVKKKAEQYTAKAGQVAETVQAMAPEKTAKIVSCPAADPSESQAFRLAAASASIPLKQGLTLVSIWENPEHGAHDLESLTTVQEIDNDTVKLTMANNVPEQNKWSLRGTRTLCIADLLNARQYETAWGGEKGEGKLLMVPDTIAGATHFSLSRTLFQELKAGRPAELEYFEARESPLSFEEYGILHDFKVKFTRVEPQDVPYSVVVNGERKDLPAVHVRGGRGNDEIEAYVLDDPSNPLTLNFQSSAAKSYIRYLKINYPAERKIEKEIAQDGCAAVYGIYFDFDSARVRPESGAALKDLAGALDHNPDWKLKIEGHTDNIGGEEYNRTLSSRRAEAVAQSLIKQYSVSAARLTSAGFGASQPKGSNDTVEGRALNRRVEACRQ